MTTLHQRTLPHFNQLVIWTLLAIAALLAIWPFEIRAGERAGCASVLCWLPDAAVHNRWSWLAYRSLLLAGVLTGSAMTAKGWLAFGSGGGKVPIYLASDQHVNQAINLNSCDVVRPSGYRNWPYLTIYT